MNFDPNAAAAPGSGIFGLPHSVEEARVAVLPVPFDATTSYAKGAAQGPEAIVEASRQVDLFDIETGRPYEQGIALVTYQKRTSDELKRWNAQATRLANPIIELGGEVVGNPKLVRDLATVNELCERVNALVHDQAAALIAQGKLVALIGGDHMTPFGSIQAHAEAYPGMGLLHVDAHADLRRGFEGFVWSHASIMFNVAERIGGVKRLVQVGVRDFCEEEHDYAKASRGKVITHFDALLARERLGGVSWLSQCERIVKDLPMDVYISFDIDGLDPALCPNTGTPVPGGLSYHQATSLIAAVVESGRRIVGLDLNEVSPGPEGDEWDANVGARLLYKMIGWALVSADRKTRPAASKTRSRRR